MGDEIDAVLRQGYWHWKIKSDRGQECNFPADIRATLTRAGLAIVPVEPTDAMLTAGEETFESAYTGTVTSSPDRVWPAMLRAAQETGT